MERLQKILSGQGICSRRQAEEYIAQGRVKVNGITASVGQSADPERDEITFDGRVLPGRDDRIYLMLNKPPGYVTTLRDPAGRPDVSALVADVGARVYPVGRLDMDSQGLLIMTNDGELAQKLTHPSHEVYKKYAVTVRYRGDKPPEPPEIALTRPMSLDGRPLAPVRCTPVGREQGAYRLSIEIREGRNRQIRRMCELLGYTVMSLTRVAIGDVKLGSLPLGSWRHLTEPERDYLIKL